MNCELRAVEPEDVDRLYRWENDPQNWLTSVNLAPMSRFKLWSYANNYDANPLASKQLTLMLTAEEETVGYVELYDISPRDGRAMCGIFIAPEFRRKGYGTTALSLLWDYCTASLGLRLLAAEVAADNLPSADLFLKAGFNQSGVRPRWFKHRGSLVDAILLQREQVGNHEG